MEITLLIMEKSWKNHGIVFLNFCGNPVLLILQISYLVLATDDDDSKTDVQTEETFISKIKSVS